MKNIFKRGRISLMFADAKHIRSAEDQHTEYVEMPDGLRLIFRYGV